MATHGTKAGIDSSNQATCVRAAALGVLGTATVLSGGILAPVTVPAAAAVVDAQRASTQRK